MEDKRILLKDLVYNNSKDFDVSEFKNPNRSYSAIYGWFWNAPVSKKETLKQIKEFSSQGVKKLYIIPQPQTFRPYGIPTLLEPNYLTYDYFKQIEYAITTAEKFGIEVWLYDEGGWPSGTACGKVVETNPKAAKSFVEVLSVNYKKGQSYIKSKNSVAAFIKDEKICDGYKFDNDCIVDEYVVNHKAHLRDSFVNLIDSKATETFLKVTHEEYEKNLSSKAKENVFAYFTDEPTLVGPFPYSLEFADKFRKETSINIEDYLPYFYEKAQTDKDLSEVYIKWYDFCSKEFCENFFKPCKEWINSHGYMFTGHLDKDDVPMGWQTGRSFNLMRALRYLDIPGVDVIWQQIYPGEESIIGIDPIRENKFFPRYASSVATQIGSNCSLAEVFGVYGAGLTFEKMRYVIGFLAVRGINVFNPLSLRYGERGFLMTGELPTFRKNQACMADLGCFNEYLDRLTYLCSLGNPKNNIALYFPQRDLYTLKNCEQVSKEFENIGFSMEKQGLSFDILDDDVLTNCDKNEIKKGKIKMGLACYDTVVMQSAKHVSKKAKESLEEFSKNGGKLILADSNNPFKIIPNVLFKCDYDGIREYTRVLDNGEITFVYNQDERDAKVDLSFKENGFKNAYEIDITDGKIYKIEGNEISKVIYSGETIALLLTNNEIDCIDTNERCENQTEIKKGWFYKRNKQCIIGEMEYEEVYFKDKYQKIQLGDWRKYVGGSYSGSCTYKNIFKKPETQSEYIVIDLGQVNYTCELFINSKFYGVKVMNPYCFKVPTRDLKENNRIEIRVFNTMANERAYTKVFEKWDKNMLTQYDEKQNIFDQESLPSGLFGPVIIKF